MAEGVQLTLEAWTQARDQCSQTLEDGTLVIKNAGLAREPLDAASRSGLKVTVKVFAYSESCSEFTRAVRLLMHSLGTEYVDSLTLALPPARKQQSIEEMKSIWTCAVGSVIGGQIRELGVSDLDAAQLQELYAWAEEVKPTANQINLETCCVIPPELNAFAKLKDIRLLTHNDPRDLLPRDKLLPLLSPALPDHSSYSLLWITRYSVLVTASGVIDSKGYLVGLRRGATKSPQ